MYVCSECDVELEDSEVQDREGLQVIFKCPNGCGDTLELEEIDGEEEDDDELDTDS